MAGVRGTILAFLVFACMAAGPALGQRGVDGRPRPSGYPDTPSMAYGATPPCLLNGVAITCEWYGFAHTLYPALGAVCMSTTRRALSNTTLVPLGQLKPYSYYYLSNFVFDTTTNDSYCLYGCFDMSADGPTPAPPIGFAPPPVTLEPPPAAAAPPPATLFPPPPATLFPPPPAADLAPAPVLMAPPPPSSLLAPPPDSDTPTPPAALPPSNLAPPPPGNTRVVSLNGAAFLQPTGLLSFIVSGALLILNGLVAF